VVALAGAQAARPAVVGPAAALAVPVVLDRVLAVARVAEAEQPAVEAQALGVVSAEARAVAVQDRQQVQAVVLVAVGPVLPVPAVQPGVDQAQVAALVVEVGEEAVVKVVQVPVEIAGLARPQALL
jgi:hypothetical protein